MDVMFLKLFFIIFASINVLNSLQNIGHILPLQWLCVAILTWVRPTPRIGNKMSILCLSQNERKLKVWNQFNCRPRKGPRCEVSAYICVCLKWKCVIIKGRHFKSRKFNSPFGKLTIKSLGGALDLWIKVWELQLCQNAKLIP